MTPSPLAVEVKQHAIMRMRENTQKIAKCIDQLSEEEIWQRPNTSSNSMGNLILHLCGNITQYIISSLRGKEDCRVRDEEFGAKGGYTKKELQLRLESTVAQAIEVIQTISDEELLRLRPVQAYEFSGVGNVIHAVEHYSYHTGQIAFWTKQVRNKDLGFYAEVDLNRKGK
ncbi:MAG: DinB family protein [Imperialibacter sp.]|uniref:DinB family protein n=1 Tax=Imperialibacter sp. TaxID=2038411 RepID=UPI0032EE0264